jgi:hypothetical protein
MISNRDKPVEISPDQNASIEKYNKLLKTDPYNITYLDELGNIYKTTKQYEKAIEYYNNILCIQPFNGVHLNNLGMCYFGMKKYEIAINYFKKILVIKNDIPEVYNNISSCYVELLEYKSAESILNISLSLRQDNDIHFKFANLYFYMKKYKESLVYFKKLPKEPQYLYNMCFTYLALQKFKIGFKLYENRLLSNNIHPQTGEKERIDVPQLQNWNGIDDCKRLLVIYEQGIGDNIQYYRFIIELSLKYPNMKITYFCKNVVSSILMPYNNIVVNSRCIDTPNFDYKVFIMSLPSILKVESISPNIYNYILQDTAKINYWNEKMRPLKKYKIGFLHKGLLASFIEKNVSIKEFEKLTKLGLDIEIICICKLKELGDEIKSVKNITFFDIDNDSPFTDTVAILQNIDLLITIDSALVHIAGIMGIKTWLLIGYGSDWRWGNTNQTYWYKSVEILRISTNIHLNNIMKDVQKRLIDFVAAKNAETIIYI